MNYQINLTLYCVIDRLGHAAAFRPALMGFFFYCRVTLQAHHEVVKIDQMTIKVGAVNAGELDLVTDLDAAATAHAGAIHHDRVDADHGFDLGCTCGLGTGFHHHRRTDGDDLVDIGMRLKRDLDAVGDKTFHAGRAVVGAQDQFVADGPEGVFPEHQILVAKTQDSDHIGAGFLVAARLRKHRRHAQAATHAHDLFRLTDVGRNSHRSHHAVESGADPALLLHLFGCLADRLDHQRDGAFFGVEVGDGEGNALALLIEHDDHKLPRLGGFGHQRVAHLQQVSDVGKILSCHDLEIGH